MEDLAGKIAVVTGGAAGIGRGIVGALLDEGCRVVIADIEAPVLTETVAELSERGDVRGVLCDVSDPASVEVLAHEVYGEYGACHVLWNNAGVTSGGGGNPWEQEPNDWRWCFGVNVFGTANGVLEFVPRMIAGDEAGVVVTTSSGDGGIAPVPYASVYASSKAAISCFTEALAHQFVTQKTKLSAAVFYPSGGLLETGLWEAQRNRPADRRRRPRRARPVRGPGGEGRPVRDQPQPRVRRRTAARPGRRHRPGEAAALGPRGSHVSNAPAPAPMTGGTP